MEKSNSNPREIKIHYAVTKDGTKLFSFHRHDYNSIATGEFIDGGFDYIRTNCEIKEDTVENLIADIREQFEIWTSVYDKEERFLTKPVTRLLKELDEEHIEMLIQIMIRIITQGIKGQNSFANIYKSIFENELKYRKTL